MRHILTILAAAVLAGSASAQDAKLSKEDVAKLARAGVSDDLIVAVIDSARSSFTLSVDDIAGLKKDGVSDKVLAAMIGKGPAPAAAAAPKPEGNLTVRNAAQRGVKVVVNERDGIVDFRQRGTGQDLERGTGMTFAVRPGEYRIAVEGAPTRHTAVLPATLLVRGADTEYLDVLTVTVEDGRGREVLIMHSEGRVTPGQMRQEGGYGVRSGGGFYGPSLSYLPSATGSVLLGAGVGAIIGHQSGHRTRGALIGAGAGLLIHCWRRRW